MDIYPWLVIAYPPTPAFLKATSILRKIHFIQKLPLATNLASNTLYIDPIEYQKNIKKRRPLLAERTPLNYRKESLG